MTYLEFLAIFLLPALVVASALASRTSHCTSAARAGLPALALLVLAAWMWTTPWDAWIIRQGVWSYPGGGVVATLFGIPVEEFLFMAGQTAVVGLLTLWHLTRAGEPPSGRDDDRLVRIISAAAWTAAAGLGLALTLTSAHGTYLGTMLLWFAPLLAVQSAVGADILRARRTVRVRTLVPVLAYLWAADHIAIAAGVWHISSTRTYGITPLGLPVEEAAFFFVTSLLVTNGVVLAVHPLTRRRVRTPRSRRAESRATRGTVLP